jgi:hypothetical protein
MTKSGDFGIANGIINQYERFVPAEPYQWLFILNNPYLCSEILVLFKMNACSTYLKACNLHAFFMSSDERAD